MRFNEWCEHHGGDVHGAGSDKICEFDDWGVAVDTAHPTGGLVTVSKKSNPQEHDYRALLDDVEFTEDGIDGQFEGNMSSRDGFSIEELQE